MILTRIGLSTNDVLQGIDSSLVQGIRHSFDRSLILRNSIKLSLPVHITDLSFSLDVSGFYTQNTATSIIANRFPIGYSFWFGAIVPRIIVGIPLSTGTELWASANYFEGPADMWMGIQESDANLKILSGAVELKHYVLMNNFLNVAVASSVSVAHEINSVSTGTSAIKFVGSSWVGNELISYDSRIIMFPTYASIGTKFSNFSGSIDTGIVFGDLSKSDSFSRQGVIGPIFGSSDMYLLNVISRTKYKITFFEPLLGIQLAYNLSDSFKITIGYMPSLDLSINTGSLRITWNN